MKTKQFIIGLALVIITKLIPAQIIGFETIDTSQVSPWIAKVADDYQSVYHFGDSELESDFLLIRGNDQWDGQIRSGIWAEDGKSRISVFKNLTNVSIKGNKFYSDETNGEFVIYHDGQNDIKGLKVYTSWSGLTKNGEYEIGRKSYPVADYFSGKFPHVSMSILSGDKLRTISKADLKLMRNEIFARYGYRFKTGDAMDTYFRAQEWYTAQNNNVDSCLTDIEKTNIKTIKSLESKQ
jgi:YARHG domain